MDENIIEQNLELYNNNDHNYINYKFKICNKPWGYEFLCYESSKLGMWFLNIKYEKYTSLHCHLKKDTIIICCEGIIEIELLDQKLILLTGEIFLIPKRKFHALKALVDDSKILEIEIYDEDINFSDKNDLIRYKDNLKRYDNIYSNSIILEENNISNYFLLSDTSKIQKYSINSNTTLEITNKYEENINSKYILIEGKILHDNKYLSIGSLINKNYNINKDVLFLKLDFESLKENKKIILNNHHIDYILNKNENKKIILTSGCFDILHKGHVKLLRKAKELGDLLIVCLSSDKQIKYLKGESRPINNLNDRIEILKSITYIDYIIPYDEIENKTEKSIDDYMLKIKPEYWIKGTDYNADKIKKLHPHLKNIKLIDIEEDISTTILIDTIKNKN